MNIKLVIILVLGIFVISIHQPFKSPVAENTGSLGGTKISGKPISPINHISNKTLSINIEPMEQAPMTEVPPTMVWPFPETEITSHFGPRDLMGLGFHHGLDFGAAYNVPIPAVIGGTVIFAQWNVGNEVRIQNGNYTYIYGHLNRIDVVVGQEIFMGQHIGLIGSTGYSTGPHLHLEIWENGVPTDPYPVLKDQTQPKLIPQPN